MKLGQVGIDLMRSIQKASTCSLNFDLNFTNFPNTEIGNLKLRLLFTGVGVKLRYKLRSSWRSLNHPIDWGKGDTAGGLDV